MLDCDIQMCLLRGMDLCRSSYYSSTQQTWSAVACALPVSMCLLMACIHHGDQVSDNPTAQAFILVELTKLELQDKLTCLLMCD